MTTTATTAPATAPAPAPAPAPGGLTDAELLRAAADHARRHDTAALLRALLPGLDGVELRALTDRCRFAHTALLVFPSDGAALAGMLAGAGLAVREAPRPSTVVRERLAARYGRDAAGLPVGILRPAVTGADGEPRVVEVFALTVPPGSGLAGLAARERVAQHEAHLGFEVVRPDPLVLRGLCALLDRHGARPDGGGYNPHEDGTVLYFTVPADSKAGYPRIELYAPGDHRELLAEHLARHRAGEPAEVLLRQLTGAWTTQALAVFAELGLPDAMDPRVPCGVGELAAAVGADEEALRSLLRYLAMLGAVLPDGGGYRLAPTGELLRAGAAGSLRPLALLYAGPFYRSFGELAGTVRTGRVAFDGLFGENHFDHFARDPELAELFDRSMAASARMFDPLPAHPAVRAAAAGSTPAAPRTVVDLAGGTGELLSRLLAAHPGLRGVLLERPHVAEAARVFLDGAGCGERVECRAGGFADVPAGGDVYLLSRVLHDWDDERCREILGHLAAVMPAHAELLVVERLLPEDGTPSLATAWDLHMRCNVGGRERTAGHYARLFADAGLELTGHDPLPLDAYVLRVRKAGAAAAG
ncbi:MULTISPECIES: methyltransferase [Kitasatospora]|uniref:Putative methyltransferase n=1 Tax=Kitasatospora setae (strain ATCC 33774 / DSM 43861 / JCM 3304 / KCC A-0304 / NBRC 14216 / KM-6054) TaxID=452652 RepID=E4N234_KITSK|nr:MULTISPECIES: methyltransferase [Kitasatospora]BAJ32218.1 putative methyltransferase [Kitasatospora setae KM-6054]